MRCVESIEISALIDGELDRRESESLARHIMQCNECRDEKARLLSLSAVLRQDRQVEIRPVLDQRMITDYRGHFAPSGWFTRLFATRLAIPLPVAAATFLLISAAAVGAYQAGRMNAEQIVITRETPAPPPPVATGPSVDQTTAVPMSTIAEPRMVTRIVNVCRAGKQRSQGLFSPPQSPKIKSPVFTATMTENGYLTDLQLAGFEPLAELNAQVIKGVKK